MRTTVRKDLAWRRVAGELFVVDAASSRLHELNGTAAFIWEGLAAGKPEAAIAAGLAAEYEVEQRAALADVGAFAAELRAAGLITEGKE
jgi:hypothetical protein